MQTNSTADDAKALRIFPFFEILPASRKSSASLLKIHFSIVAALYGVFLILAGATGVLHMDHGIGVVQNPPFFAHLTVTLVSIPFVTYLVRRTVDSIKNSSDPARDAFSKVVMGTQMGKLVFVGTAIFGLFALAGSIVMASTFQVDIYDSTQNIPTFAAYTIIRCYQYLICYPALLTACLCLPVILFLALRRGHIGYLPFAVDGMGDLKKYLRTFDGPIFGVQCLMVAIALANYVGWGGFTPVSAAVALGAPIGVGLLAGILYLTFAKLVRTQRLIELNRISMRQQDLYVELVEAKKRSKRAAGEIADELEANSRVSDLIRGTKNWGWLKYLVNVLVAVAPKALDKEVFSQFVSKLFA